MKPRTVYQDRLLWSEGVYAGFTSLVREKKEGANVNWNYLILVPAALVLVAFLRIGWVLWRNRRG